MSKDHGTQRATEPASDSKSFGSKRAFIKGAAAVPVVMAVTSRPVLGNQLQCTASALGSASHLSHHPDVYNTCIFGCSPGFWKGNLSDYGTPGFRWPGYSPSEMFKTVFGGYSETWAVDSLSGSTLGEVVGRWEKNVDKSTPLNIDQAKTVLGFHAVAALFNSTIAPWGYRTVSGVDVEGLGITPQQVVDRFRAAYNKGFPADGQSDEEYKQQLIALKSDLDIYDTIPGVVCPLTNNGKPAPDDWDWSK